MNKLLLCRWLSLVPGRACFWEKSKRTCAWQICIFEARSREFWAEIDGSELDGKFKELKSWKRKQQLVWDDENVAACGCGKENAQWNTKNNIRCGSPHSLPSNFIVADFHVRLCLLPSLSLLFIYHIYVTFRNSAERRGLTSLCPKSFVLCASLFQG